METFTEQLVTHPLEMAGKIIVVETIPTRVCVETDEQFFSPETTERLQKLIWEGREPSRVIEVPVFEFA